MKKKMIRIIVIGGLLAGLMACGNGQSKVNDVIQSQIDATSVSAEAVTESVSEKEDASDTVTSETISVASNEEPVDVDLTTLSSTMVYSEVYNMMCTPEEYMGKMIKMKGNFTVFQNEETGQLYFACIINDATACCAQGIEFELEGEYSYPEDYPQMDTTITVTGIFDTYDEGEYTYCTLRKAKLY